LVLGTEPAVQDAALRLYQQGERGADLEWEMGARAMADRTYDEAAQHLAQVTDGPWALQAQMVRTLALALLGRPQEAHDLLRSLPADASPADAQSANWLARFLERGQTPAPVERQAGVAEPTVSAPRQLQR
jgi:hypothetical protein